MFQLFWVIAKIWTYSFTWVMLSWKIDLSYSTVQRTIIFFLCVSVCAFFSNMLIFQHVLKNFIMITYIELTCTEILENTLQWGFQILNKRKTIKLNEWNEMQCNFKKSSNNKCRNNYQVNKLLSNVNCINPLGHTLLKTSKRLSQNSKTVSKEGIPYMLPTLMNNF